MAESGGFEPPCQSPDNLCLANRYDNHALSTFLIGGRGRIWTHEPFLISCFQDRCNKPDSATLPFINSLNGNWTRIFSVKAKYPKPLDDETVLVAEMGIEPIILRLMRPVSLPKLVSALWWNELDLNQRPVALQATTLPTELPFRGGLTRTWT